MTVPSATLTVVDGSNGALLSSRYAAVIGPSTAGTINDPAVYYQVSDVLADYGRGPMPQAAALLIEQARVPVICVRTSTVGNVAAWTSPVDCGLVTGTSVITITGTPTDYYGPRLRVTTGGTIGVAGIVFEYSLDDGETWSSGVSLGVANTYAMTQSGLTWAFAGGTLVAGDTAICYCRPARWNSNVLDDAFDALLAYTTQFEAALIAGECTANGDLTAIADELENHQADNHFAFALCQVNDRARTGISEVAVTFVEGGAGNDTITRAAGSFVDDGFVAGQLITVTGSANNNGTYTLDTVAALTLTLIASDDVAAEAGIACRITAETPQSTWRTAIVATYTETDARLCVGAGMARITSELAVDGYDWQMRRGSAWAAAVRYFQKDPHISMAELEKPTGGPVIGRIDDGLGVIVEHDERLTPQLDDAGFLVLRTHRGYGVSPFINLPRIKCPPTSRYSRVHFRAVADRSCNAMAVAMQGQLHKGFVLDSAGHLTEAEARRLDGVGRRSLEQSVGAPGYVSSYAFSVSRTDVLNTPGAILHYSYSMIPLGYPEEIEGTAELVIA